VGLASTEQNGSDSVWTVHTGSQLCSFLHTFGQTALRRYRTGATIHSQPTAAARRKRLGITRGSKRQPAGRPPKGDKVTAKHPRLLETNISSGVPHAKSHGKGH